MPRLTNAVPKYRKHRATGQALTTIAGKDCYLGPYGTKASKLEYDRLITEWLAAGRPHAHNVAGLELTVNELLARYWQFAKVHYRKRGKGTSELDNIRHALRPLKELYGRTTVADFGPLALKALQVRMIHDGLSRGVINSRIGKIKRVFRWAVSEQFASGSLMHALSTVMGLQCGRTAARETEPIGPVDDATVDATLPYLPPTVADMVRLQRLTGCRPAEVCLLRPADIDRTGNVWLYRPTRHKTEHHGRSRVVAIGPRAQAILLSYLLRESDAFCFSPAESERQRKAEHRANRRTKVQPSQVNRSKRHARRKPGEQYSTQAYLYAVRRACDRAFPAPDPLGRQQGESLCNWEARLTDKQHQQLKAWQGEHRWSPNQLRHAAATAIRRRFGLEAAQVTLGHAAADVTQIYAERDLAKAVQVMREVG